MKTKYIRILPGIIASSILILPLWSCEDDVYEDDYETVVERYLDLSVKSFTFDHLGNETLHVTIESSDDWSMRLSDSTEVWVLLTESGEKTVSLKAEPNPGYERRHVSLLFSNGRVEQELLLSQADKQERRRFVKIDIFTGGTMSLGGKYIAGTYNETINLNYYTVPVRIDVESGEVEYFPMIEGFAGIAAISDDGTMFLGDAMYYKDGEWVELEILPGWSSPQISGVSADGSLIIGYRRGGELWYTPCIWRNGVPEDLPYAENSSGQASSQGFIGRGCSADGSVIFGTEWTATIYDPVYWRDGEYHVGGMDVYEAGEVLFINRLGNEVTLKYKNKCILNANYWALSPDGEWLATSNYQHYVVDQENFTAGYVNYPAYINTTTHQTKILWDYEGAQPSSVANGGIAFFHYADSGHAYDLVNDQYLGTVADWLRSKYGITVAGEGYFIRRVVENAAVYGQYLIRPGVAANWYLGPEY